MATFPQWSQLIEALFDGLALSSGYLEIYKNPTVGEMAECADSRSDTLTFRALLTPKGFFLWNADGPTIHSKVIAQLTKGGVSTIGTPIIPFDVEYDRRGRMLTLILSSWAISGTPPNESQIRVLMKKLPPSVWAPFGGLDAVEVIDERDGS